MRFHRQISGRKHERQILWALFLLWSRPTSLTEDVAKCVGEFRTTFRTIPAFVAQWIEQRFPKPQVVGPIPTEGASSCPRMCTVGIGISRVDPNYVFEIFEDGS